jgi:hypothetical protein
LKSGARGRNRTTDTRIFNPLIEYLCPTTAQDQQYINCVRFPAC